MSASDRLHRDRPTRTAPIRSFSGLYGGFEPDTGSTGPTGSSAQNNGTADGQEHFRDDSVGLAYRIIEKYINDGKRNAGLLNGRPYARVATDRLQELFERTLRSQSELIPLWIEALTSAVKIDPSWMPNAKGAARGAENNGAASHSSKAILIEVASVRPVQVSAHLHENCETLPLVTLRHAVDESRPQLSDIGFAFDAASGAISIKISIPDSHPPGVYSGVIVSRNTGEPLGTLSVRIAD